MGLVDWIRRKFYREKKKPSVPDYRIPEYYSLDKSGKDKRRNYSQATSDDIRQMGYYPLWMSGDTDVTTPTPHTTFGGGEFGGGGASGSWETNHSSHVNTEYQAPDTNHHSDNSSSHSSSSSHNISSCSGHHASCNSDTSSCAPSHYACSSSHSSCSSSSCGASSCGSSCGST
jgi:hypothetical protein